MQLYIFLANDKQYHGMKCLLVVAYHMTQKFFTSFCFLNNPFAPDFIYFRIVSEVYSSRVQSVTWEIFVAPGGHRLPDTKFWYILCRIRFPPLAPSEEFELTAISLGAHIETHGELILRILI